MSALAQSPNDITAKKDKLINWSVRVMAFMGRLQGKAVSRSLSPPLYMAHGYNAANETEPCGHPACGLIPFNPKRTLRRVLCEPECLARATVLSILSFGPSHPRRGSQWSVRRAVQS